jgi:hypothetical protein
MNGRDRNREVTRPVVKRQGLRRTLKSNNLFTEGERFLGTDYQLWESGKRRARERGKQKTQWKREADNRPRERSDTHLQVSSPELRSTLPALLQLVLLVSTPRA